MLTKHAIIILGFIASLCNGLEYLKGKNGDPWNSWGNGDSKINDEIDEIDDNEAKILPARKNNFRQCPKYYTTLRTLCGGINEASCPRNFKCMASRFDPNIEICCRPNASIIYPEPDTSFRDNFIVPEYLPVSPVTTVTLQFKSLELAAGQLISNDDIDDLLSEAPTITNFQGDSSKFYTIMLFGNNKKYKE
uniref:Uncharacterized protein n=1 Tax=Panagrolaimus sp. ES5 TaxID=591445 RepID=A0AC34GR95_9BILA